MNQQFINYYWQPNLMFYPLSCSTEEFWQNQLSQNYFVSNFQVPSPKQKQNQSLPIRAEPLQLKVEEKLTALEKPRIKHKIKKNEEYAPRYENKPLYERKKKYERDADRNILPNIVNKLYSFVGCKSRCKHLVSTFLNRNPKLLEKCSVNKYFHYHKQLRSSLNKFLLEEDLLNLFQVQSKLLECFSEQEQKCFIKINIFMLHLYYRDSYHITSVVNSCRISKGKTEDYLKYFRITKQKVIELSSSSGLSDVEIQTKKQNEPNQSFLNRQ